MEPEESPVVVKKETDDERSVRKALRRMDGRGTVADLARATGLDFDRTEASLKQLLDVYRGHLAVGESGDLVYSFDPRLIRRDHDSWGARLIRAVGSGLAIGFKVWIMLMLVVYFAVFVVLALAMLVGVSAQGGGRRGGGRRGGAIPISPFRWFWAPRWRVRRRYYGNRHEQKRELAIPFYKKIFSFVFGPDDPELTDADRDQEVLQLVRARRGVLTVPELVELNGAPLPEAEEEMGRVVGRFGGEPQVTADGEILYAFPDLMVSAHGPVLEEEPVPTWRKLEKPKELTGNGKGTDTVIAGLNGFNLFMAATSPVLLMPQLGLSGPLVEFGLFQMPLAFSTLFFAIPAVRSVGVKAENGRRWLRNVRRAVVGYVYRSTLGRGGSVSVEGLLPEVRRYLRERTAQRGEVEQALHQLAAEFDADVVVDDQGHHQYTFPKVRQAFLASADGRSQLRLEERSVGDVVYSSADDAQEAEQRDLKNFDRELAGYVEAPKRVRHLADYEVAEFDRMLAAAHRAGRMLRPGSGRNPRSRAERLRERRG